MKNSLLILVAFVFSFPAYSTGVIKIHVNQVGFNTGQVKIAIIESPVSLRKDLYFNVTEAGSGKQVYQSVMGQPMQVEEWRAGHYFYRAEFTSLRKAGEYRLTVENVNGERVRSASFRIGDQFLTRTTIPALIKYFRHQRANTAIEWKADSAVLLYGSTKTADVRGGWCDASGDVSKYFSHLAYTNYMMPQQTPLVTWSLINTAERIPGLISEWKMTDSLNAEAFWGADYLMRSLSAEGYFYMTVFSYFDKDPKARRIVGLLANSVTTSDYQCAFREGGGMAIAALARISSWREHGEFSSAQYLHSAERAYAHLLVNNEKYCDDGKENIIDEYCALMAATELWIATDSLFYRNEAREWAIRLAARFTDSGRIISNDASRPFWHASDAGLPVRALLRYLERETDEKKRAGINSLLGQWRLHTAMLDTEAANPFHYPRQEFVLNSRLQTGFFIPHENESGWWWQGENARLASLATVMLGIDNAGSLKATNGNRNFNKIVASQQVSWILGANPYDVCFLYGFGQKNVPYMASSFGHGSGIGGISNGITGKDGAADGRGIDYLEQAEGNEWRWTEQWIPHAAWFLQAMTELAGMGD